MAEKIYKPGIELLEQTGAELERKITSPEDAAEMTRQRREYFGLGEAKELTLEQLDELEESIKKLLKILDQYRMDDFSQDVQEEWYFVELEAMTGKDREIAKVNLEQFLQILPGLKG